MIKMFVCFPSELLQEDIKKLWFKIKSKLKYNYPSSIIVSNYTGDGTVTDSDSTFLILEYRHSTSYIDIIKQCEDQNKGYTYISLIDIDKIQ